MTKKAFDKIAAGLTDAIAIARGEAEPARLYIPAELDVKAIRRKVGQSQEAFAQSFGFTIEQIRAWEQVRNKPVGGLRAYLTMIDLDPDGVLRILEAARKSRAA